MGFLDVLLLHSIRNVNISFAIGLCRIQDMIASFGFSFRIYVISNTSLRSMSFISSLVHSLEPSQSTTKHHSTKQTAAHSQRHAVTAAESPAIGSPVRLSRPAVHARRRKPTAISTAVHTSAHWAAHHSASVRVVAVPARVSGRALVLRRLKTDVLTVLVTTNELRFAGPQSSIHGLSDSEVALVELTLFLLSTGTLLLALLMRAAGNFVFHLAAEGLLLRRGRVVARRQVLRNFFVFGDVGVVVHDICFAGLGVLGVAHAFVLDALAFFAGEGAQVFIVVVWVSPDASGWFCGGVDEELVACFWVV